MQCLLQGVGVKIRGDNRPTDVLQENQPELAIIGLHAIKERPAVVDGEIAIRSQMYLSISFDHRWIDGHIAVQFVVRVKEILEHPENLWFSV